MTILTIDQLKSADVLLFSGANDSISQAINHISQTEEELAQELLDALSLSKMKMDDLLLLSNY